MIRGLRIVCHPSWAMVQYQLGLIDRQREMLLAEALMLLLSFLAPDEKRDFLSKSYSAPRKTAS